MSHRRRPDFVIDTDKGASASSPPSTAVVFHDRIGFQMRLAGVSGCVARSVETIPEALEAKVFPSAARL